jgi:hypothetical protein
LAENLTISVFTRNKIWTRSCEEYSVTAYATGDIQGKLSNDDFELTEVLTVDFN